MKEIPRNEIWGAIVVFSGALLTLIGFGTTMYSMASGWPGPIYTGILLMIAGILISITGWMLMKKPI